MSWLPYSTQSSTVYYFSPLVQQTGAKHVTPLEGALADNRVYSRGNTKWMYFDNNHNYRSLIHVVLKEHLYLLMQISLNNLII